jgi:hypothetical protein
MAEAGTTAFGRTHRVTMLLCIVAVLHAVFMWSNRGRRPELAVIDPPPTAAAAQALSFGDSQFLYRYWALDLQNDGDTGGRATPMRDYDYDNVLGWLKSLQALDPRAQHHVFLATRYFSQTPHSADIRRLVDFIVDDVARAPARKWYWLTQAEEMAEYKLKDLPYALAIAETAAGYDFPEMPSWIWLFPAVLLQKEGRPADASAVIDRVRREKHNRLEPETLHWMKDFQDHLPAS